LNQLDEEREISHLQLKFRNHKKKIKYILIYYKFKFHIL